MSGTIIKNLIMQTILAVIVGFIVSITANIFIEGARYFLSLQSSGNGIAIKLGDLEINLLPVIAMPVSYTHLRAHET